MADLNPGLADYQRQFAANRQEAAEICEGLSTERFNLRPTQGAWSVGDCISHLNVSARQYSERITIATQRARMRGHLGDGPFQYGMVGRWMIRAMEPPPKKKYKSPSRFTDVGVTHEIDKVLDEFSSVGEEWIMCLKAANGLHLARVKVR